ncbi:hypothetical protein U9M48_021215 [Paspalum notatum var. saurae]|uniref:Uncharacterized protein n=1 Tax=Paspalum notatum var. saurae TaxID=547442 RepID=A0AAQ3TGV9_PASNO
MGLAASPYRRRRRREAASNDGPLRCGSDPHHLYLGGSSPSVSLRFFSSPPFVRGSPKRSAQKKVVILSS